MSEPHTILIYLMWANDLTIMAEKSDSSVRDGSPGRAYWRMSLKIFRAFASWAPIRLTHGYVIDGFLMALIVGRPNQEFSSLSERAQQHFLKFFRREPRRFTLLVPEKLAAYPRYSCPLPDGSGEYIIQIGPNIKSSFDVHGLSFPERPENEATKEVKRSEHAKVKGSKTILVYWASRDDWVACARSSEFRFAGKPAGYAAYCMCWEAFYRLAPLGRVSAAVIDISDVTGMAVVVGRPNRELMSLSAEMQHELLGLFGTEPRRLTWIPGKHRDEYFSPNVDGSGEELVNIIDATPDGIPSYSSRVGAHVAVARVGPSDNTNKEGE